MISKSGETETFRLVLQKSAPYFFTLVCYINKIVFNHYEIVTICIYCSLSLQDYTHAKFGKVPPELHGNFMYFI